jgi:hypothetical chaperone protein
MGNSAMTVCGLDFGTSNSAIGVVRDGAVRLTPMEDDSTVIPTAVFYDFENNDAPVFGRRGVEAYVSGVEGRLMRALKSLLGSTLIDESTALRRRKVAFTDVIVAFVSHLKSKAEAFLGCDITHVVHGRPVHFFDGDDAADARAQSTLADIAQRAGFRDVHFVCEPVAAAYQYDAASPQEELILVADIGGGTSDFSVVRVASATGGAGARARDILGNHGVRIGGTDFDRLLSLKRVMPLLGMESWLVEKNLPMPRGLYSNLATWARINSLYQPRAVQEVRDLYRLSAQPEKVKRLVDTVEHRLGHRISFSVEAAKLALSADDRTAIDLGFLEPALAPGVTRTLFNETIQDMADGIRNAALRCLSDAGVRPEAIRAVFLTGGSCRVPLIREAILEPLPGAHIAGGDDLASVALGLTQHAMAAASR